MGRGPGNLRTEDIIKKIYPKDLTHLNKIKRKIFLPLKKKFKWGPNQYYKTDAHNKIHPTYIQQMLADTRFKKNDYKNILKNLKNINAKKYEPTKLYLGKVLAKGKKISSNKLLPNYFIKNKRYLYLDQPNQCEKTDRKLKNLFVSKNFL